MAQSREDILIENWSHLRVRILDAHPRRRSKVDVLVSLDEEFKRLARGLLKLQVSSGSYKIIQVNHYPLARGYITAKSRDGFAINIHEKDYELFQKWANMSDEQRLVSRPKYMHGYRLSSVQPDVKKPIVTKQAHEIVEESDKLLNGDEAGDM